MNPIILILGSFLILTAITLYLYLVKTPLDVKISFRNKENKPINKVKFENDAPAAPDLLFGDTDYTLPVYEQIPPKPRFTMPEVNEVSPTPLQEELAQILWYKKQLTSIYRDDKDMVIVKNGKNVGVIRCIEKGRIHAGHIEDVIELAKQEKVRTIYLLALGKIDRPAFKLAVRSNVKLIDENKLNILRSKSTLNT